MRKKEFAEIRRHLDKTQNRMAQILGVSAKAVQSFEQGWREIPVHIERQILLILALKRHAARREDKPCWLVRDCPAKRRQDCPAWEFDAGHLCWFINGTICEGQPQGSWEKKMKICRDCEVYQSILPLPLSEPKGRAIRAAVPGSPKKGAGKPPRQAGRRRGTVRRRPVRSA